MNLIFGIKLRSLLKKKTQNKNETLFSLETKMGTTLTTFLKPHRKNLPYVCKVKVGSIISTG